MFDQVSIRVADYEASERFYRTVLGALDVEPDRSGADGIGWDDFALAPADAATPPTRNLHLAFVAPSRERVDEFWRAGTGAGHADAGAPGERPEYTPGYYGAFLRDPDGNSAEAVHHLDVRRGGRLDHLWIGVRDLDAAVAFYTTIMPCVGLREGRRWEAGHQFRGAWATFSLVADSRPVTEHLRMAFPAPDPQAVDDFHATATNAGYDEAAPAGWSPSRARRAAVLDPDGTTVESVFRNS